MSSDFTIRESLQLRETTSPVSSDSMMLIGSSASVDCNAVSTGPADRVNRESTS